MKTAFWLAGATALALATPAMAANSVKAIEARNAARQHTQSAA